MNPNNKANKNIKDHPNNLLINNDKYTKNFVDVDINLKNNKQLGSVKTKYKPPGKVSKPIIPPFNNNANNNKIKNENNTKNKNKINEQNNIKAKGGLKKKQNSSSLLKAQKKDVNNNKNEYEIFNSDISIISTSTNKNSSTQKDRIKLISNKLENLYKEALNNSQKIKSETLPFNINYNQKDMIDILLEEIKFLKIKNELIKLKSNFQETIFYSITELIEETKRYTSANPEITEYLNNFHNKILCILTQNNQNFYEHLKISDDNSNSEVLFAFNLKDDFIMDKINQKNISVLSNIEENIQNIIHHIDEMIKFNNNINKENNNINENNSDFTLKMNSFKLNLLMASNNIISYYLLSDNFTFQFKNKHKFMIFNPEDIINNQVNQRKNKIKSDWEKLVKPLIHKVLTPKNEKDLINFILNLSLFYENLNKNINIENTALKINYDINNGKLNSSIEKFKKVIENYCSSNEDGFMKLNEVFNFLDENQSKNTEKVIFSLINTEKQNFLNLIYNFNLLKNAIIT